MRIAVKTSSGAYEALIAPGLLTRAGECLGSLLGDTPQIFLITTAPVRHRWAKALLGSFSKAGYSPKTIKMPDGERFKRLATLERLAERLVQLGADRRAVIVAFGGGVIQDVAGMLASIYMRGVRLIAVPTTVQAQLDAAIGGKNGVNLRVGKNLVGTFLQPQLVLVDPATLSTLPDREFRAGMYEAIKCGVIGNHELFSRLEGSSLAFLRTNLELQTWTIAECVKLKARVVSVDEKESGLRRVLNFGHTLGHALEAATQYRHFLHGEAVAWGMIAAAAIAGRMGRAETATCERIRQACLAWGKLPKVTVAPATLMKLIRSDKKTESGIVHFVLPRSIGEVEIISNVPEDLIVSALKEVRRLSGG